MQLRFETQLNPVADEVSAIAAVARPILLGTLFALKRDVVDSLRGYDAISLRMLARVYRAGDGDCGICFEYAVHDAVRRHDAMIMDRVADVLTRHCRVPGADVNSILFGAEKAGAQQLIETATSLLTDESLLLYGTRGRPVRLKRHITTVASAFRRPAERQNLPQCIAGLWKADLFLGKADSDKWVGTTVKINPAHLEGARGLRIGIVPANQGETDAPRRDENRNLIVCPLPYDGSFMQVFYEGWQVVKAVLAADADMPREAALPRPPARQVARYLIDRRDHPVLDIYEAMDPLSQPELLDGQQKDAEVVLTRTGQPEVGAVVAPFPRTTT
ncbi:hypothetical protein [Anaeromyxobacter sp. SG64]|uniref:hypothetical protein n=1 Tax=Anaeromyxobacter sp. SG64 TaxID=2925409 RepID=UPI001F59B35D|nr:hypothetical protein [Anaeromyxobacter sp. SG64]